MIYQLSEKAIKQLSKLEDKDKKKIARVLESIDKAIEVKDIPNIVKIKGSNNYYRIKVTPYRVLVVSISDQVIIKSIVRRNEHTYKNL